MANVKQKIKSTLKDLIEKLDWTKIESTKNYRQAMSGDTMTVQFASKNKKESHNVNLIRVRLGADLMTSLGWNFGDRIIPLFNSENQMRFLLVKSDTGSGYLLSNESKSRHGKVTFPWLGDFKLDPMRPKQVPFEISKKKLIFEVKNREINIED